MNRTAIGLFLAAASLLTSACATHERTVAAAAATLAQPAPKAVQAEANGLASLSWNDNWAAAKLLERAAHDHPTVQNRFNLAYAYQRIGRDDAAASIYQALVTDGQFTWLATTPDYYDPQRRPVTFNVSEEAARRLNAMGPDAAAATAAGAGGPAVIAISDADALKLDADAASARPPVAH